MTSREMTAIYDYIDSHVADFIAGLKPFLSQPTVSTQGIGVRETSNMLNEIMKGLGIKTRIIETPGSPVVFGELQGNPEAPTILIYGHYDVQPPEPLDAWFSPPFEPTIRNGRIYARGAGDNKGQLYAQLMGVRAHLQVNGSVPMNIKFILEGEEENGSPHLEQFVAEHKELLKADLVYTSDGPVHESGRPVVVLGARGVLCVELTARDADRDLHSGNWGGPIPNPAWRMIELLSTMKDPKTGRILIEHFYDRIVPATEEDRETLSRIPMDRAKVARELGLEEGDVPPGREFYERLMFQPTLNICGFLSGYVGKGMKTVLPSKAMAKVDMRLVVRQDPDDIFEKFVRHVRKYAPDVEVVRLGQMRPSRTPFTNPYSKPIVEAVKESTGEDPIIFPSLGGSLPDYAFTGILGLPSLLVPYANFDESNHAPNENLAIENFVKGIKCCATVLSRSAVHKKFG